MADGKFISYLRVSTDRQGRSGLGIDAQREAVTRFLNGGNWTLVTEYVEVESGKRDDNRPQLQAALRACRKHKATLVIAKLDRLSRNLAFIAALLEAGVEFVAADMPTADRTMLQMMAVFAEHERRMISERTKAALAAKKAQGAKLGNPRLAEARAKANANAKAESERFAATAIPHIEEAKAQGAKSYRQIAEVLNKRGIPTAKGKRWEAMTVRNVVLRADDRLAA